MRESRIQKGMKNKVEVYLEDEDGFFEKNEELLATLYEVMSGCLEEEKVPYDVEISLTLVGEDEIQEINKQHRQIDRVTDVLSFPQLEAISNGKIDWQNRDTAECMNLDTNQLILGDIILCYEKAVEQAQTYGHSLKREVCFLIAHSLFHLLGYDHMNEADEKLMVEKQEKVLQSLNILR